MLSTARDTRARFLIITQRTGKSLVRRGGSTKRQTLLQTTASLSNYRTSQKNRAVQERRSTLKGGKNELPLKAAAFPLGQLTTPRRAPGGGGAALNKMREKRAREQQLPARTRPVPRSLPAGTRGSPSSGPPASCFAPTFFKGKYENRKKNQKENPTRKHEHTSSTPTPLKGNSLFRGLRDPPRPQGSGKAQVARGCQTRPSGGLGP